MSGASSSARAIEALRGRANRGAAAHRGPGANAPTTSAARARACAPRLPRSRRGVRRVFRRENQQTEIREPEPLPRLDESRIARSRQREIARRRESCPARHSGRGSPCRAGTSRRLRSRASERSAGPGSARHRGRAQRARDRARNVVLDLEHVRQLELAVERIDQRCESVAASMSCAVGHAGGALLAQRADEQIVDAEAAGNRLRSLARSRNRNDESSSLSAAGPSPP